MQRLFFRYVALSALRLLRKNCLCLGILFAFLPGGACLARELVLEYAVLEKEHLSQSTAAEVGAETNAATAVPVRSDGEESHRKHLVGLGEHYFFVDDGEKVMIYQFDKRMVRCLFPATKTYSETPLFALLSFRVAELQNRLATSEMLRQLKVSADMPDQMELESLFSLKVPGSIGGPHIDEKIDGQTTEFIYDNEIVA